VNSTASPLKMLTIRMVVNSATQSVVVQAEGAQVGSGVSEVQAAFVTSLEGYSLPRLRHAIAIPERLSMYGT
jgi:hypothetical protein